MSRSDQPCLALSVSADAVLWSHPRPITSRLFGEETGEAGSDWWAEEGPSIMSCVFCHLALLRFR